jgi:hypothetical protein
MTIPVWVLLLFAGWTLATLLGTVGVYRWSGILTRHAALSDFRADEPYGSLGLPDLLGEVLGSVRTGVGCRVSPGGIASSRVVCCKRERTPLAWTSFLVDMRCSACPARCRFPR